MPDLRIHERRQLVELARRLGVRADWHEPDEQGVSAEVYGVSLDNAMPPGTWMGVDSHGARAPHAELYVVLTRDDTVEGNSPTPVALINLATLLAWACGYDERGTRCTCATVSANGDPEAGDVELDVNCPTHGTEAGYAILGRRYEALMARLAAIRARPEAEMAPFDGWSSYESLERFVTRSAELVMQINREVVE